MMNPPGSNFAPSPSAGPLQDNLYLVASLDHLSWALPVSQVIEVMRPLPVAPAPGAPGAVAGTAMIRGEPTPIVDLRRLVGAAPSPPSRFIVVRAERRRVALAVDHVPGVERIPPGALEAAPHLLSRAAPDALEAVTSLHGELLHILRSARLIPGSLAALPT